MTWRRTRSIVIGLLMVAFPFALIATLLYLGVSP
jgi:hypothetical protein